MNAMPTQGPRRKPPAISRKTKIGPDVDLDRADVRLADGTRLTNGVAEAINAQVRRKAGRPPLSGAAKRSPQVSTRIRHDQMKELQSYSKSVGKSVSYILREALDQFLKDHGSKVRR